MFIPFDNEFTINRLTAGANNTESYVSADTAMGILLPLGAEDVMMSEGNPAKTHKLHTEYETDLREADKITYDGVDYIVQYVKKISLRSIQRLEAIVVKHES